MKQKANNQKPRNKLKVFVRKYWWALIVPALVIIWGTQTLITGLILQHKFEVAYNQLKEVHQIISSSEKDGPVKSCRKIYFGFNSFDECRVSLEIPMEESDKDRLRSIVQRGIDGAKLRSPQINGSEEKGDGAFISNSGMNCSIFWGELYSNRRDISISMTCRYDAPYHLPGYTKTEP